MGEGEQAQLGSYLQALGFYVGRPIFKKVERFETFTFENRALDSCSRQTLKRTSVRGKPARLLVRGRCSTATQRNSQPGCFNFPRLA